MLDGISAIGVPTISWKHLVLNFDSMIMFFFMMHVLEPSMIPNPVSFVMKTIKA